MLAIDESLSVLSDDGECWDEAEESSNSLNEKINNETFYEYPSKVACEE